MGSSAPAARHESVAEPPVNRVALAVIVAIALGLRVAHVAQPMRYDEAFMFLHWASQSLATVLSDYSYPNNHILHTLLVWIDVRLFGNAPWVLRLPTLIAGVLLVPATYLAARRLARSGAPLFAAALVAAFPALILYSTNARGYVFVCLAFLILIVLASNLIENDSLKQWLVFAVVVAAGAYTIPIMLYPAGGIFLWIVVEKLRTSGARATLSMAPRLIAAGILAGALALVAYSPVIASSGASALVANKFVTPMSWSQFLQAAPRFALEARELLGLGIPLIPALLLVVAALTSFISNGPQRARRITLVLSLSAWCIVVLLATKRPPPARVWLFLLPLFCIYAGAGLAVAARALASMLSWRAEVVSAAGALLLVVTIGLANGSVRESEETDLYGLREAPEIARFLLPQLHDDDRIVAFNTTGLPLDFYLYTLAGKRLAQFSRATNAGTTFIVVNERHGQTVERVVKRWPTVAWEKLEPPVMLHRFGGATVYASPVRAQKQVR